MPERDSERAAAPTPSPVDDGTDVKPLDDADEFDDETALRAALDQADIPALLTAVAQQTGDLSLLRADLQPNPELLLEPDGGLSEAQLAEARALAFDALQRAQLDPDRPPPLPDDDALHAMIRYLVGPGVEEDYYTLLREELALHGDDPRAPQWHKDELAPDVEFTVAIVGAGMSGIAAAHRLHQAGVPFVIFEKNADVGGTWFENRYPGCRVDVPNHLYSYSFAQTPDWPGFFSSQDVLLDYFRRCTDDLGLREHIRFGTEVVAAAFDEEDQVWRLQVRTADDDKNNGNGSRGQGTGTRTGSDQELEFHAVVSAVGQLNRPSFPAIPGRERFAGPSFHSARWDYDVPLEGRRVAVIGTGASAAQFIPTVAEQAGELVIFQRTPPWLVPSPDYHDPLPDGVRWLLHRLPTYGRWDRLWQFWRSHEGLRVTAAVDPEWPQGRSVSAANDVVRELLTMYLREEFPDDELFEKVLPTYPPIAKRVLRDNGIWSRTLHRPNVELCTESIAEITEAGVKTSDGVEHEVDVLIYGTGFSASKFLTPMTVQGRDGIDLHERWDGDPRAFVGVTVPCFPNLFLLYGPNTNLVINGSIIFFSECQAQYILESVRLLLAGGHRSMEPRLDAHDAYNERIDEGNRQMAWGASDVHTWYKSAQGRVTQNWPFSLLEYWQLTRRPDPADYTLR